METTTIDGLEVPVVPMLNTRILEAIEHGGELEMGCWHGKAFGWPPCGTIHCIAGWSVMIGGVDAIRLEEKIGTLWTAIRLFLECDPASERPVFDESNESAMIHLRERAAREQAAALDVARLRDEAREGKL